MIRDIAGRHNHTVKLARKLQKKKHRRERGLIVGEGMDLLRAAVATQADLLDILLRRELLGELPAEVRARAGASAKGSGAGGQPETGAAESPGVGRGGPVDIGALAPLDIGLCSQEILDYASALGGSADVIFICRRPEYHLSSLPLEQGPVFYLDEVGDPGNVGTLCRSAVAFGFAGVVCSPATADPYSPKALRAGMGAQFTLPVVTDVTPDDLRVYLSGLAATTQPGPAAAPAPGAVPATPSPATPSLATSCNVASRPAAVSFAVADPHGGVEVDRLPELMSNTGHLVIVLGEERSGPRHEWPEATRVTIPQARFDSLNVAMAGTILAYEVWRARRSRPSGEVGNQRRSPIGLTPWKEEPSS